VAGAIASARRAGERTPAMAKAVALMAAMVTERGWAASSPRHRRTAVKGAFFGVGWDKAVPEPNSRLAGR
jgi:hypothetical protein